MAFDCATVIGARTARPPGDARIINVLLEALLDARKAAFKKGLGPFLGAAKATLRLVIENININPTRALLKMLDGTDDDDAIARSGALRVALLHS